MHRTDVQSYCRPSPEVHARSSSARRVSTLDGCTLLCRPVQRYLGWCPRQCRPRHRHRRLPHLRLRPRQRSQGSEPPPQPLHLGCCCPSSGSSISVTGNAVPAPDNTKMVLHILRKCCRGAQSRSGSLISSQDLERLCCTATRQQILTERFCSARAATIQCAKTWYFRNLAHSWSAQEAGGLSAALKLSRRFCSTYRMREYSQASTSCAEDDQLRWMPDAHRKASLVTIYECQQSKLSGRIYRKEWIQDWTDSSRAALRIAVPGYRRRLLGLRVEGLRLAGPEQWLVRAGKALLQAVPIAQVPASSLQALGTPGACLFSIRCSGLQTGVLRWQS